MRRRTTPLATKATAATIRSSAAPMAWESGATAKPPMAQASPAPMPATGSSRRAVRASVAAEATDQIWISKTPAEASTKT